MNKIWGRSRVQQQQGVGGGPCAIGACAALLRAAGVGTSMSTWELVESVGGWWMRASRAGAWGGGCDRSGNWLEEAWRSAGCELVFTMDAHPLHKVLLVVLHRRVLFPQLRVRHHVFLLRWFFGGVSGDVDNACCCCSALASDRQPSTTQHNPTHLHDVLVALLLLMPPLLVLCHLGLLPRLPLLCALARTQLGLVRLADGWIG